MTAAAASDGPKLSLTQKAKALVGAFKPAYWQALIVVAALYFARFDASFVSLRAKQVMPKSYIPLVFFVSSLIQTFVTAPLAKLSGTGVGFRNKLLGAGFIIMIMANGVFGLDYFASTWGKCCWTGSLHIRDLKALLYGMRTVPDKLPSTQASILDPFDCKECRLGDASRKYASPAVILTVLFQQLSCLATPYVPVHLLQVCLLVLRCLACTWP